METTIEIGARGAFNNRQIEMSGISYTKAQIRDQIKIGRYTRLIETGEQVPYFTRIIEEISAGNYPGLLTVAHEFALSLGIINRVLDRIAPKVYNMERMPLACELETLRLILGPEALDLKLEPLGGKTGISDGDVRRLFFAISGSSNAAQTMALVSELTLDALYKYVWQHGLDAFLANRYKVLKGHPEKEMTRAEIINVLSLPAVFDEAMLIQRFTGEEENAEGEGIDIRDQLAHENAQRAEALTRINTVYRHLQSEELEYDRLERLMAEARMELEISYVQKAGIDKLRDYLRTQAVVGARQIALRYEFVCPSVSASDILEAGSTIARSYFGQAQNSKKGSLFLRAEVLNNLKPFVASGACHRLPGNFLLALIRTMDGEEHFVICKQSSKLEQDAFMLRLLANFYFYEVPQKAVYKLLNYYIELQSGGIRTVQAIRKLILASPIVIGMAGLVGVLYYIVFSHPGEALMLGAGILLLGSLIAAKNGYEEDIKPVVHQKIPSYVSRKNGRVTATTSSLNLGAAEQESDDFLDEGDDSAELPSSQS